MVHANGRSSKVQTKAAFQAHLLFMSIVINGNGTKYKSPGGKMEFSLSIYKKGENKVF